MALGNDMGAFGGPFNDPSPEFSITDMIVSEGVETALFMVSLSDQHSDLVSVDYLTVNGTALAGVDFQQVTGTLTFKPGETVRMISIPILDDEIIEKGDETFTISFSNPVNATLVDSEATLTLADNDLSPEDLVGRSNGTWWVAQSHSNRFERKELTSWSTAVTWHDVLKGDFNGDHRTDLAGRANMVIPSAPKRFSCFSRASGKFRVRSISPFAFTW